MSPMTKHTPGPWEASITVDGRPYVVLPNGDWIAKVYRETDDGSLPGAANAHMMAASSDMYEALQALVDDFGDASGPLIDKAKAALAKARGETVK